VFLYLLSFTIVHYRSLSLTIAAQRSAAVVEMPLKSSQASKARLQSSKHTGAKQTLTQNAIQGRSRSRVLESIERR